MSYFDSVFVINLDRRVDRWSEAERELVRCGLEGERFSAVEPPPDTPGRYVVGCTASHRAIWRRVAAGKCGDRTLILEDDFVFTTRALLMSVGYQDGSDVLRIFDSCSGVSFQARFSVMLAYVPDRWDLLYLGGGYESTPRARINTHVIRNNGMHTTHAYAIARKFACRVTELLDKESPGHPGPCDSMLANWSKEPDIVSYTLTPRLFIQRPTSHSDIDPKPLGFPWSMTDAAHEGMV